MRSPAAHRRADSRLLCAKLRGVTPLHPIEASALHARRERVFLVLSGIFLGSMTMLNILGVSRFLDLSFTVFGLRIPMALAVGRAGRIKGAPVEDPINSIM